MQPRLVLAATTILAVGAAGPDCFALDVCPDHEVVCPADPPPTRS